VPEPALPFSFDGAADLLALGADVRAEWRADEATWMQAAAQRWAHGRRIADLLREYAARGDHIAIDVAGCTLAGAVVAVGDDRVDLATAVTTVSVRTACTDAFGAVPSPILLRRTRRARAGGSRVPSALVTFRMRLLELEEQGSAVRLGTFAPTPELVGRVIVGADHVVVRAETEVVVPLAWAAYVAAVSECGA
jgi:hypothetical protein